MPPSQQPDERRELARSHGELPLSLRPAVPADYDWIINVVDAWWGRPVSSKLPRLFLDHFHLTSVVGESTEGPVGFLVGFHSPAVASMSYIHFVAVEPTFRQQSLGRHLYERFFETARRAGRSEVMAITAPGNTGSVAFHRSLGFSVSAPQDGYNGPDATMVIFRRSI
jgi:ribosomal protein S18 acetylase RimI-like enzyme